MSAIVLQLPGKVQRAAKLRMTRVDVEAQYRWVRKHSDEWGTCETDGAESAEYLSPRCRQLMKILEKEFGVIKGPTMTEMRQRIAEGRKLIGKRNLIKAWIASLGADLDMITTPEQALSYAFDRLA